MDKLAITDQFAGMSQTDKLKAMIMGTSEHKFWGDQPMQPQVKKEGLVKDLLSEKGSEEPIKLA